MYWLSAVVSTYLALVWRGYNSRMRHAHREGQGLVEYSLLLMLVAVVAIAIISATGKTLSELWYDKIIAAF